MWDKKSPVVRYGVPLIGVIVWYMFVWNPLEARMSELEAQRRSREMRLVELDKAISRLKDVGRRLQDAKRELDSARKHLIPGSDPQIVASKLQDILLKEAAEQGVDVLTYKTGPVRKWKEHELAVVVFTMKTDTRSLVDFLKALCSDKRIFRVRNVNIVKVRARESFLRARVEFEALCL